MQGNIRKIALITSLLLILSQWFSIAHATGHHLINDNPECQICTLQHHFHSTTLDVKPCATDITITDAPYPDIFQHSVSISSVCQTIRAPPR